MEKQLKIVRIAIFGFGAIFFCIGAVMGYQAWFGPATGKTDKDYILPLVFMAIGLMDVLIVTVWSVISASKAKKEKWLMENGQSIRAKIISIDKNTMINVNSKNPYVIVCEWRDPLTSETRIFKSRNIWTDPAPFVDKTNTVSVYYDPGNIKNYAVDLSFLPAAN
ncbi:MAG: hypothetical protein JWO09_337 [Bacteroidetes bacterium]|nr:hypothetical protein [Bacteroidota bacterium]